MSDESVLRRAAHQQGGLKHHADGKAERSDQ